MIGPDLHPRARAAYDRTSPWAHDYYRAWGARVRAEREARKLTQSIPDELMNELSDSDDERILQVSRHAPTPMSMPSSPLLVSLPKPIDTGISIKSNIIESKSNIYDGAFSPVDIDNESVSSASWQTCTRRSNQQSTARHSSSLSESKRLRTVLTRSRTSMSTTFFHLATSGQIDSTTVRKHNRISASRTTSSKMYQSSKGSGAGVRRVQRGRVAKRRS